METTHKTGINNNKIRRLARRIKGKKVFGCRFPTNAKTVPKKPISQAFKMVKNLANKQRIFFPLTAWGQNHFIKY